jgi:hypothetical protein
MANGAAHNPHRQRVDALGDSFGRPSSGRTEADDAMRKRPGRGLSELSVAVVPEDDRAPPETWTRKRRSLEGDREEIRKSC